MPVIQMPEPKRDLASTNDTLQELLTAPQLARMLRISRTAIWTNESPTSFGLPSISACPGRMRPLAPRTAEALFQVPSSALNRMTTVAVRASRTPFCMTIA